MNIAVTSQNRRDVTRHAGRCRDFRVFDVDHGIVLGGIGHDGGDYLFASDPIAHD